MEEMWALISALLSDRSRAAGALGGSGHTGADVGGVADPALSFEGGLPADLGDGPPVVTPPGHRVGDGKKGRLDGGRDRDQEAVAMLFPEQFLTITGTKAWSGHRCHRPIPSDP